MDRDIILLKQDAVYFYAAYTDPSFSVPIIDTLIYKGVDPEHGYMFEKITDKDKGYICFPEKISPSVLDQKALIQWLSSEHNQQTTLKTYEYRSI